MKNLLAFFLFVSGCLISALPVRGAVTHFGNVQQSPEEKEKAAEAVLQEGLQLLQQPSRQGYLEAVKKFELAQRLFKETGNQRREAVAWLGLGRMFDNLGEKPKALEFYTRALPLFRVVGDRDHEATILNNIGGVHSALGEKSKALESYNQALELRK